MRLDARHHHRRGGAGRQGDRHFPRRPTRTAGTLVPGHWDGVSGWKTRRRANWTVGEACEYSAIQLFVQSARRAHAGFRVGPDNISDVVRICALVAGMPLGILLASAWMRMLSTGEIAEQLATGLDLLETDLRDVSARQRSTRAAFDHSWSLLTAREQEVMAALSVFRGGFTQQAARGRRRLAARAAISRRPVARAAGGRRAVPGPRAAGPVRG